MGLLSPAVHQPALDALAYASRASLGLSGCHEHPQYALNRSAWSAIRMTLDGRGQVGTRCSIRGLGPPQQPGLLNTPADKDRWAGSHHPLIYTVSRRILTAQVTRSHACCQRRWLVCLWSKQGGRLTATSV